MLRIGLTGGIGAGKSTVSSTFSDLGAVVVDGDVIAREVVEPGTPGLASLVDAFGDGILQPDGALDRPALAAIAFSDDEKRATLNGIVHPLVAQRRSELIERAQRDRENPVIIEDIPLLVESQMAPMFPLVAIVNADPELRVKRLIEHRNFSEADARARIAAQATEAQRREVADVWLDNSGSADELVEKARALWHERIAPFAHNIAVNEAARSAPVVVPADPEWAAEARRILARLRTACGHRASRIDHIGSTAVPGLDAKDVIDVQVTVSDLAVGEELTEPLLAAGYVATQIVQDTAHDDGPERWQKRLYCSADPGRPTNVHVRVKGWPGQQFALLFVDWLTANPDVAADYVALKRRVSKGQHSTMAEYADAKEPWFVDAYHRAWEWADATGWAPRAQP